MFATLLATAIDKDTARTAHPAYVDVLRPHPRLTRAGIDSALAFATKTQIGGSAH